MGAGWEVGALPPGWEMRPVQCRYWPWLPFALRIPGGRAQALFLLRREVSPLLPQWRYCIRLENLDSDVVQLRERHWRIFSLSGTLETVRGRGVVGREPVLSKEQPAFQYSSHVSLQASSGHMWGTFRFERPDGSHFDIRIPPFSLESNKDEKTPPSGLHW